MKFFKFILLLSLALFLNSCASGYKTIDPKNLNYNSNATNNLVTLEYKYDLLQKKYAKKEAKKGVKLVAVKIKNYSGKDLIFGKDVKLTYGSKKELYVLENEVVYKSLKQSPASYLWYLLLTPIAFNTTSTNSNGAQEITSSTPVGLVIGPGLAGGNMIVASSANKKFKRELSDYNLNGMTIKNGETAYGLIGIKSDNYDSIKIKIEQTEPISPKPDNAGM
ncbi:MAG: hypothetical protein ABWZ56_06350 [Flavobacterium sp.]